MCVREPILLTSTVNQVDNALRNLAPPASQNSADLPPRVPVPAASNHHVHGDRPAYEDVQSPYYLSTADHPGLALVTPVLTYRNFQPWTRDFKLSIGARNKSSFLDGTLPKPSLNDPLYSSWIGYNQMVQSWILHSVSPEIKSSIMYRDTATDMWTELNNRFNQGNGPRIFELNENLTFLHQGDDSVSTYFTKLTFIWDGITQLRPKIPCTCVAAAKNQEYHNHDQVV
uniref:Retrotransposon Copia-like N-terminal domain-containing protein n=1 Tax=Cannabis sativa TaxID=3483 RepID=A0A803Q0S1_CANSA